MEQILVRSWPSSANFLEPRGLCCACKFCHPLPSAKLTTSISFTFKLLILPSSPRFAAEILAPKNHMVKYVVARYNKILQFTTLAKISVDHQPNVKTSALWLEGQGFKSWLGQTKYHIKSNIKVSAMSD